MILKNSLVSDLYQLENQRLMRLAQSLVHSSKFVLFLKASNARSEYFPKIARGNIGAYQPAPVDCGCPFNAFQEENLNF
jgi:hypothetical protein